MTRPCTAMLIAAAMIGAVTGRATAAQLLVEPVTLELNAPAAAGILTLRNNGEQALSAQTRVFRWSQSDGQEHLDATADVAASPPIVRLMPHGDYTVRIVRTSKQPVVGEESYRVMIDELPPPRAQADRAVTILLRQAIPIFFRVPQPTKARVSWSVTRDSGKITVSATNAGDERLRLAALALRDAAGSSAEFGNGLVGYVLGHSTMNFALTRLPPRFGAAGEVLITAESNYGPIRATAPLQLHR